MGRAESTARRIPRGSRPAPRAGGFLQSRAQELVKKGQGARAPGCWRALVGRETPAPHEEGAQGEPGRGLRLVSPPQTPSPGCLVPLIYLRGPEERGGSPWDPRPPVPSPQPRRQRELRN